MKTSLFKKLEEMEQNKRSILRKLGELPLDYIQQQPPNMWSMMQAMRHVQISESLSVGYMKKKFQAGDKLPSDSWLAVLKLKLLYLTYFFYVKFKAPKVLPKPVNTTLEELEKDWTETRRELKLFVEEFPDSYLDRGIYKHPFAGRLNLRRALHFMNAHLLHHMEQTKRIEDSLKKLGVGGNR